MSVACTVRNSGERAGAVAEQLYVRDEECPHPRPPQELKAFAKVHLQPGQSERLEFELDVRAFSYVDPDTLAWRVDPGRFRIRLGLFSRHICSEAALDLT